MNLKGRDRTSFLLSHFSYLQILDCLGLQNVPIVCETHRVSAFQDAICDSRNSFEPVIKNEFVMLARCNYLIAMNEADSTWLEENLPAVSRGSVPILFESEQLNPTSLAGYEDLAALVTACDPDDPALKANGTAIPTHAQTELIRFAGRLDLLYVDSNLPPNISGLKWFLEKVFIPKLAPLGLTMIVAGSIKDAMDWSIMPNIVFVGNVRHMAPLYAATKICIPAIGEGTYGEFNVIEAISFGKPILCVNSTSRKLPGQLSQFVIEMDGVEPFTVKLLSLIGNPIERLSISRGLCKALTAISPTVTYYAAMDRVLADVAMIAPMHQGPAKTPLRRCRLRHLGCLSGPHQ